MQVSVIPALLSMLVSLLTTMPGHATTDDGQEWLASSWGYISAARSHRLDFKYINQVADSQRASALQLLHGSPFIAISDEQAAGLIGKPFKRERDFVVLARAVRSVKGGRYAAFVDGEFLEVAYGVLTNRQAPYVKEAVVLELDRLPTRLFVTSSAAQ